MDFFTIGIREIEKGQRKGEMEIYPDFRVGRSKDLMVRAKSFYAIWDEEAGLWSTDEYDVQRLVDKELDEFAERMQKQHPGTVYHVKHLVAFGNGLWAQFRRYMQNVSDNSHQLDENLTFANTEVSKKDYVSRRLPYSLEEGDYSAWDELVGTLYNTEERAKIEWAIGAIVAGDAKRIQKFLVLYGPAGTGKSTILDIIMNLFQGYTTTFEAKALGSNNAAFSTEVFKGNPLVAIQHDGDLSKIEDNTKLNSIISHEEMTMNEKHKPSYTARVNAFLFMGTNQPVKISDAKSGIIRRLIDVTPTGVIIPANHYFSLMSRIDFELGAIAHHCLQVYLHMGKNYYRGYRPIEMMFQTDVFFNFIEAYYDQFKADDNVTLKAAYTLYKEYCADTGIDRNVLPQYKVREELRNYFDNFKEREFVGGETIRSVYSGFNADKFKAPVEDGPAPFSLVIEDHDSIFDEMAEDWPAQGQVWDSELEAYRPERKWENVTTTLKDLDTHKVHYVKVPENHIVIDFDLKDVNGEKSLERNLQAASGWPPTYAELSKSGNGVHLHYLYDGDVSKLAAIHSDGIEVKTLLGNAALRRRLSKCNSIPVATYVGTLPQKEKKKMLTDQTIQSEKGLRDLIARAKNKEFNPGTKTACSFIKKILDDAYDSGMEYDVSDLKGDMVAFANSATNQPMQALKLVTQMKWKSENAAGDTQTDMYSEDPLPEVTPKDDRIVFFDVEVYPNLFVICWKYQGDGNVVRMINPTAKEVEALLSYKLVGFYNRRYDNHIVWAAMQGYPIEQLYKRSVKIVDAKDPSAMFGSAYALSYADIYDFSTVKQSLKKWQVDLGILHKEMDIPWDQPVPEERIKDVVEYCVNDVLSTEAVFEARKGDFNARQILAEISSLTVNDTTAKHTAKIIFGNDKQPQQKFVYTDLSKEFPGYTFDLKRKPNKSEYRGEDPSEGGYVYAEPGMYENVAVLDVASMHPTSIEQLNLFGEYTKNFSALKEARIAIKRKDFDTAREMLGGRLKPFLEDESGAKELSDALKIVINSVYGLTSASFDNPFRDVRNKDNIVAKRGALFMIDLKHLVQEHGFTVAHIKTDSIKIPNATPEIIEEVFRFGEKYGYEFEHESTYEKFCLVNDAVYIAKDWLGLDEDGNKQVKWEAVGAQFQHPYVYKELFTKEEIDWDDLCEAKSVQKGTMYIDYEHDRPVALAEGMQFIGRTSRFVPVTENSGGGVLYRNVDGKNYAVAGTKGHLWLEADVAAGLGDKCELDMSYYDNLVENAVATIEKFGNFEEFVN